MSQIELPIIFYILFLQQYIKRAYSKYSKPDINSIIELHAFSGGRKKKKTFNQLCYTN